MFGKCFAPQRTAFSAFVVAAFLLTNLPSCAGRRGFVKSDRYVPESKKTIYLADIVNHSSSWDLPTPMYRHLQEHFQNSSLLRYVGSVRQSDLFLDIEILNYAKERFNSPPLGQTDNIQLSLRVLLNFIDTESKAHYIKNKTLTVRHWYSHEGRSQDRSIENDKAQRALFDKLALLLDELIQRGHLELLRAQAR